MPTDVRVGHFMGAPAGAAISEDEKWLVSVGNGLVAYRLRSPWRSYGVGPAGALRPARSFWADPGAGQWWEIGRGTHDEQSREGGVLWLARVQALKAHQFLLTTVCNKRRPDGDYRVGELILDADRRTFRLHQEWVEAASKRRDDVLRALEGWVLDRVEARGEDTVLHLTGPRDEAEVILRGEVRVDHVEGIGRQGAALAAGLAALLGSQVRVSTMDAGGLQMTLRKPRGEETRSPAWIGVFGREGVGAWEVRAPGAEAIICPGAQGFPSERPAGLGEPGRVL